MLKRCNSKRWHSATAEALSSGRPGTTDARQIAAEHSLRQNAETAESTRESATSSGSSDLLSSQQQRTGSAVRMPLTAAATCSSTRRPNRRPLCEEQAAKLRPSVATPTSKRPRCQGFLPHTCRQDVSLGHEHDPRSLYDKHIKFDLGHHVPLSLHEEV